MATLLRRLLLLLILFAFTACAPPYLGKRFPADVDKKPFDASGEISATLEDISLKYNLEVDPAQNEFKLDGKVQIRKKTFNGAWDADTIIIYFYLLDENLIILKREAIFAKTGGNFADNYIPFHGSFQFIPECTYVVHGYDVRVSM